MKTHPNAQATVAGQPPSLGFQAGRAFGQRPWRTWGLAGLAGLALGVASGRGQLAITEVMSCASTNKGSAYVDRNADWWELTNYGTNAMDLTGYLFSDRRVWPGDAALYNDFLNGVIIKPCESIVFVRSLNGTADEAAFKAWWGETNLRQDLQIIFYDNRYGFDQLGEYVLFGDPNSNIIDRADFGEAICGITFTSDPNCGTFGVFSQPGVCGAWQAVTADDVGSPGVAPCGPVPLALLEAPASQTVSAGMTVRMSVRACGLPRPHYQWLCNGTNLANSANIQGTTSNCLVILTADPTNAGLYQVALSNGLEVLLSGLALLTVTTNPEAPVIVGPEDLWVTTNQTAIFSVALIRGYPPPSNQWSFNGLNLPDATNRMLVIPNAQYDMAGSYEVRVWNSEGATNARATLFVTRKPMLTITEAMALSCTNHGTPLLGDWWELTNLDPFAVNLLGYRWDDEPGNIGGGPTVTNDITIWPGESVIFVEGQTPEAFKQWWGASNLPPGLKIITYAGNGLNDNRDQITVWNGAATVDTDYIDSVNFAWAPAGFSLWFARTNLGPFRNGIQSKEGVLGAFCAVTDCDVGSPGYYPWVPRFTAMNHHAGGATLTWTTQPGSTYQLYYATNLTMVATNLVRVTNYCLSAGTAWTPVGSYVAATNMFSMTVTDTNTSAGPRRFYRVLCTPKYYLP